jgi:glycosyltransferase involved in cell wall biosynthesis
VEHPGARLAFLQAGLRNRMEGKALRRCDAVLVESEFIRGQLRAHHPEVPAEKVTLVPGAVDLARFRPDGPRADLGPGPVVLTVRRHVERMGIDLLIRAAAQCGVSLVVGGDGPRRAELEALARALGVRARFVGFVPDEELPALYRGADLFVLPTRELEGFGLVAIEAMACGTPALGTPVGAIPEVLGPLGLVAEAATPEAIAAGIRRVLDARDPALPKRCREHVAARYDWSRVVDGVEQVLLEVTRARAGHGRR